MSDEQTPLKLPQLMPTVVLPKIEQDALDALMVRTNFSKLFSVMVGAPNAGMTTWGDLFDALREGEKRIARNARRRHLYALKKLDQATPECNGNRPRTRL